MERFDPGDDAADRRGRLTETNGVARTDGRTKRIRENERIWGATGLFEQAGWDRDAAIVLCEALSGIDGVLAPLVAQRIWIGAKKPWLRFLIQ
jgi:hypothetical protein